MPKLLEEFEKEAISKGVKVIWARDAAEANNIILEYPKRRRAFSIVNQGRSL